MQNTNSNRLESVLKTGFREVRREERRRVGIGMDVTKILKKDGDITKREDVKGAEEPSWPLEVFITSVEQVSLRPENKVSCLLRLSKLGEFFQSSE